jgi:hypothetical protein
VPASSVYRPYTSSRRYCDLGSQRSYTKTELKSAEDRLDRLEQQFRVVLLQTEINGKTLKECSTMGEAPPAPHADRSPPISTPKTKPIKIADPIQPLPLELFDHKERYVGDVMNQHIMTHLVYPLTILYRCVLAS